MRWAGAGRVRSAQAEMRGRAGEGAGGRWGARGERGRPVAGARALAGARTLANAQAGVAHAAGGRWVGARARAEHAGQGWLGAGRAGWPWAVHSVHSACFWPGSTRYFPESKFLDIVRELG